MSYHYCTVWRSTTGWRACLAPLAFWILLSGLDDLFIAAAHLATRKKQFPWPADSDLEDVPERRIAIFVPLWREHRVIGQMLEHNLSIIRYSNYDFFVGVYPNDALTERAVAEAAQRAIRTYTWLSARTTARPPKAIA